MGLLDRFGRFLDDVLLLPEEVRLRLEEAEAALDREDWQAAEDAAGDVLQMRPGLARGWVCLAQAREADGRLRDALAAVREAQSAAPDEPALASWAAQIHLALGDAAAAADAARLAAGLLGPSDARALAEACALLARAELERGRPDRASRELRKAVAAAPGKRELHVELIEALARAGRGRAVRAAAAGLEPKHLEARWAERIGGALERVGAPELAEAWWRRAAEASLPGAQAALARLHRARGELSAAEHRARRAVEAGGGPESLLLLGEVLVDGGRPREAADAFAAAAPDDPATLERALAAVPLSDVEALASHAEALARVAGETPAVRAARVWAALERGEAVDELPELGSPRGALVGAAWCLRREDPTRALELLDRFETARDDLGPADRQVAERLRRKALRARWLDGSGELDLAAALDAVERFAVERGWSDLERRARRVREELDRPLLLAILGEFNAGKSTLVNTLAGADVAPTGILPTTATLNVLRAGAERRVRVVRRDGTTREGDFDALRSLLEDEGDIDHVEIVVPSETLERVWILDTPGTNAPAEGHEDLAREASQRADVVLWVFDAGQAGKATEGAMLERVGRLDRPAVAVINKVDRLDAAEAERVRSELARRIPFAEGAVFLSARAALDARLRGDPTGMADSGLFDLEAMLEARVFGRSRSLKRRACAQRLGEILDDALEEEVRLTEADGRRRAELTALEAGMTEASEALREAAVDAVRDLVRRQERALAEAADEVLAFVRPRRSRFARHGLHREDRSFLAQVLGTRLAAEAGEAELDLARRALAVLSDVAPPETPLEDAIERAFVRPFARYDGMQRGLVAGGALEPFFAEGLPSAPEREALSRALEVARPEPRTELQPALLDAAADLLDHLDRRRRAALAATEERRRRTARGFGPLRALRDVLAELGPARDPEAADPALAQGSPAEADR